MYCFIALTLTLVLPPQWTKTKGVAQVETLRRGLEAANILLRWAVAPAIGNRVVHEDALQATVVLFRLHLTQHLVPSWNQTGAAADHTTTTASPLRKRRRSSPHNTPAGNVHNTTASKEWKKIYKLLLPTIPTFLILAERLQAVLSSAPRVALDDQPLLMLTNAATAALEMECVVANAHNSPTATTALGVPATWGPQIQGACLDLITAAFAQHVPHRVTILEDIFGVLLKLPTGKRSMRAFDIRYASARTPQALARRNAQWLGPLVANADHRIQMVTALLLQILHASVVRPTWEEERGRTLLRSGLQQCHTVADYLARALLSRCSRKDVSGGASEFR